MAIVLRSVKGSNLTPNEVDGNFTDLDGRVQDMEENPPVANGIANIVVSGATFTVILDDATELGPYTIPVATPRPTITTAVAATTFQPALGQASAYFRCTNAGGCVVTIPANASVAFLIDTELHFRQCADESTDGDGVVSFIGEDDTDGTVVINLPLGKTLATGGLGAVVTLKKVATNEWDIFGLLADEVVTA